MQKLRILIVCRSYATGGAAIIASRLFKALRLRDDVEVRMMVMTDDVPEDEKNPEVACYVAKKDLRYLWNSFAERIELLIANGFKRKKVFQIDTARHGYRLDRHPWIAWADVVNLHWINQGAMSLKAIEGIAQQGKKIVWTMHDMWPMTGLCHHAYDCREFHKQCEKCVHLSSLPILRSKATRSLRQRAKVYEKSDIKFIGISRWVCNHAAHSSLLRDKNIAFIPNPHPIHIFNPSCRVETDGDVVVALGAARLDDYVKGFDIFLDVSRVLKEQYPEWSERIRFVLFGALHDQTLLSGICQRYEYRGNQDTTGVRAILENSDIALCPSRYENLPNALVEGAAAGCQLVSFVTGGQADILTEGFNGFAAKAYDAGDMAKCIIKAAERVSPELRLKIHQDIEERFADKIIVEKYLDLFRSI